MIVVWYDTISLESYLQLDYVEGKGKKKTEKDKGKEGGK